MPRLEWPEGIKQGILRMLRSYGGFFSGYNSSLPATDGKATGDSRFHGARERCRLDGSKETQYAYLFYAVVQQIVI